MSSVRLDGKVAFVTGAARGIGFATAKALAAAGATVVLGGRDLASLAAAAEKIKAIQLDAKLMQIECNVSEESSVKQAFNTIFREFKRLDVLNRNGYGEANRACIQCQYFRGVVLCAICESPDGA